MQDINIPGQGLDQLMIMTPLEVTQRLQHFHTHVTKYSDGHGDAY